MASVHRLKNNQAHERLLIADYLQRKPSPAPTCPTHTRELEFFCVRCDVLICSYCQVYEAEHYAHEARSFNDAHAAVQQEMQLVVAALDARAAEMRAAAAEVKAVGLAFEKAGQASTQQLDDFFDDLRNTLQRKHEQLRAELAALEAKKQAALAAQCQQLDAAVASLSAEAAECRRVAGSGALALLSARPKEAVAALTRRADAALAAVRSTRLEACVSASVPVDLSAQAAQALSDSSFGWVGVAVPSWQPAQTVAASDALTLAWAGGAGPRSASYELQMACVGPDTAGPGAVVEKQTQAREFKHVYAGPAQSYRVAGLTRDTRYVFRVRALDAQGAAGEWSPAREARTLAGVQLRFSAPFDTNGALYHIATGGRTRAWANPHDAGLVEAKLSSRGEGKESDFVSHPTPASPATYTNNVAGSWMEVDLKTRSLCVDHYCLRNTPHSGHAAAYALLHWVLQGSNSAPGSDAQWVTLRRHESDSSLPRVAAGVCGWAVSGAASFRRFRVLLTGPNSGNHHYLTCSGIELYGVLTEQ